MNRIKKGISYLFALILLLSAVMHILKPEFYAPLIPDAFPELLTNILVAIIESVVGILLIIEKYRFIGGLGFFVLMIGFLPIHVWDLMKENPAIGNSPAPEIRVALQFILIYAGWWIYNSQKSITK